MGYPIEEGPIQCDAPGQNASYDSYLSCIIFQIPFKLELIGFGYICLGLLIPVILISIFGKIQEKYRWFILNQAIWDLLIVYDFICEKPTYYGYFERQIGPETMFYEPAYCIYGNANEAKTFFFWAAKDAIKHVSYLPLFLLTFSRFICLYYNPFYQRHSGTLKLATIIVAFNIVFLLLITSKPIYDIFVDAGKINMEMDDAFRKCYLKNCPRNNETLIPECNQPVIDACVAKIPVSGDNNN
uniref:Uncharacterized protein n=1 Tax=Panagrolaimus sp. ES5 TaxID=591445 RepID=A0AC34F5T4_9BILA